MKLDLLKDKMSKLTPADGTADEDEFGVNRDRKIFIDNEEELPQPEENLNEEIKGTIKLLDKLYKLHKIYIKSNNQPEKERFKKLYFKLYKRLFPGKPVIFYRSPKDIYPELYGNMRKMYLYNISMNTFKNTEWKKLCRFIQATHENNYKKIIELSFRPNTEDIDDIKDKVSQFLGDDEILESKPNSAIRKIYYAILLIAKAGIKSNDLLIDYILYSAGNYINIIRLGMKVNKIAQTQKCDTYDVYEFINLSDPTENGKYSNWIQKELLKGNIKIKDGIKDIYTILKNFHNSKNVYLYNYNFEELKNRASSPRKR